VMVAATMKAAIASSCTRGTATSRCNPRAVGVLRQLSFTHSIVSGRPAAPCAPRRAHAFHFLVTHTS
jgi:hypothetical protein